MSLLWIFLGGGLGALCRHLVVEAVAQFWGAEFPMGTVLVNLSGCFVAGIVLALTTGGTAGHSGVEWVRQLVVVGFLGGYTTFSAFSMQTLTMIHQGAWSTAMLHIVASVVGCMLAVAAGHALAASPRP